MLHYDVPFVSQYADLGDHEWRARGCGIAAVKMVMDYWQRQNSVFRTASLDELLQQGLAIGAHPDDRGWTHRGLVQLSQLYGYMGFNADLASHSPTPNTPDEAWEALLTYLAQGPVLASVWRYMDPEPHGGHMVVVTGWDSRLISFNDPIELTESQGKKMLTRDAFLKISKQRYIIIRSPVSSAN